jgi:hypothetical protein
MTATEFTSYDQLYPGRFLKAGLFNGEHATFTISAIHREEIEGDKGAEAKVVMSFKETPLQLVLAKVNAEAIKAMFGPSVPAWIDKRITLYGTTSIMPYPKKKDEPCIRVFGSPDITDEVRCEWTPPRRKPVVQILKPTASDTVTKALAAATKATTPAARAQIRKRAADLHSTGSITTAELEVIAKAVAEPVPEPVSEAVPEPAPEAPTEAPTEPEPTAPTDDELQAFSEEIKASKNASAAVKEMASRRNLPLAGTTISKLIKSQADIEEMRALL